MRAFAYFAVVSALALWAGNWIVARAVRDDISPGLITSGRLVLVTLTLAPLALPGLLARLRQFTARDWVVLAGLVTIMVLAGLFLGERVRGMQWAGVAVSFGGVLMIALRGDAGALAGLSFNPLRVRAGDDAALARLGPGARPRAHFNLNGTLAMLYSAFASVILAYAGWNYAVARLGAARTGSFSHLLPAFGVIFAALFLREYPAWYHFAGMALIFGGIALSALRASSASSTP